jgi:hypothetical protein
MAELFQTSPQNITQHLKSLYQEREIGEVATCKEFLQVRQEGKRNIRRSVRHYPGGAAWGFLIRAPFLASRRDALSKPGGNLREPIVCNRSRPEWVPCRRVTQTLVRPATASCKDASSQPGVKPLGR